MNRSHVALAGMTAASLGFATIIDCGGTASSAKATASSGSSGSGGGTAMPGTHAEPPAAPATTAADGTGRVTFAISKLYFGDTDPDGTPDATNGWKQYGYDLDGDVSTATSTNLCALVDNALPENVYPDGNEGIDNSFGKLVLPLLLTLSSTFSTATNTALAAGKFTLMLDMEKLGSGATYDPLTTNVFAGGDLGHVPRFDGTDMWPVRPESLDNPTSIAAGAKVSFPGSYLTGDTWVSGARGTVALGLTFGGITLDLDIANAIVSVVLDPTHKHGTKGIIAGVLSTADLVSRLRVVAGLVDSSLCSGQAIDAIVAQVTQASDILQDGTQDPKRSCDGISIGLGFDAEVVQIGPIASPAVVTPNPCDVDGGMGGGGSGMGGGGAGGSGMGGGGTGGA